VVQQADNGMQSQSIHRFQYAVARIPALFLRAFPMHRSAQRSQTETSKEVKVLSHALSMPGGRELIAVRVADTIDGAFDATPQLKSRTLSREGFSPGT
jgi:hypothetical protein